jgi:hypothetical protein
MKRIAAAVTLLAALATFLFWLGRSEPAPQAPTVELRDAAGDDPRDAAGDDPRDAAGDDPRRVPLPRPALPTRTSSEAPSTREDTATLDDLKEDRKTPQRPIPLPVPQQLTAVAIDRTIKDILPDMVTCLNAWGAADMTFSGSVALGFDIGPDGLSEVWVDDVDNVPAGPLSCLSGAVWDADWPPFQEDTIAIYPFQVEITDGPTDDQADAE